MRKDFPQVRDLTMDAKGNLYAVGTLAVLDSFSLPVKDRVETFGIARWNKTTDRWEGPTDIGGFSRDPLQMTWLDAGKTKLLLTGAFEYGNDWGPLNGAAILDVNSGKVSALGSGLMLASRDQVVAPMVRHAVRGSEIWFAGMFNHAGVNANASFAAPISSHYVAMWDGSKDLSKVAPKAGAAPGGAARPAAASGDKLPSRVAYKLEQVEKELANAERQIAAGRAPNAQRNLQTIERLMKEIGADPQNLTYPRAAAAIKRVKAVAAAVGGG